MASSSSAPSPPSKKQRNSRLELIDIELSKPQRFRGRFVLTREEQIDILSVFYSVSRLAVLKKATCYAFLRTDELLGHSNSAVLEIVKQWTDKVSIDSNPPKVLEKGFLYRTKEMDCRKLPKFLLQDKPTFKCVIL